MKRKWGLLSVAVVSGVLASRAGGITINLTYRAAGESIGGVATAGAAPTNATGTGSLQALVEAAADYWEAVFTDTHTVSIQYGWASLTSAGSHNLLTQGGTPNRELTGTIRFDNDQSTVWYLDNEPLTATEFTTLTNYTTDLGGGIMNVGREYTGATGAASEFDLYTTAIHEIGHALGLSGANSTFINVAGSDRTVTLGGASFAGADVPIAASSAHLDLDHALLRSNRPGGVRRFASEADLLTLAELSGFSQINFAAAVPEPATAGMLMALSSAMLLKRRRA
jgi:hypothetical protein